jgi:hypothetical protein
MSSASLEDQCKRCRKQRDCLTCSVCKVAPYCCKLCQKADWPEHKAACKVLKNMQETAGSSDMLTLQMLLSLEFSIRAAKLKKAPPLEKSGVLPRRSVSEQMVQQTRDQYEKEVQDGGYMMRQTSTAPLTHGIASELASCQIISLAEVEPFIVSNHSDAFPVPHLYLSCLSVCRALHHRRPEG